MSSGRCSALAKPGKNKGAVALSSGVVVRYVAEFLISAMVRSGAAELCPALNVTIGSGF
jgi:hypothetical protein